MNNTKIIVVAAEGCSCCQDAEEVLEEIKKEYPQIEIEKVDMTSDRGQELVVKHQIMNSPGIIINDNLFSVGELERDKLIKKIKSNKCRN